MATIQPKPQDNSSEQIGSFGYTKQVGGKAIEGTISYKAQVTQEGFLNLKMTVSEGDAQKTIEQRLSVKVGDVPITNQALLKPFIEFYADHVVNHGEKLLSLVEEPSTKLAVKFSFTPQKCIIEKLQPRPGDQPIQHGVQCQEPLKSQLKNGVEEAFEYVAFTKKLNSLTKGFSPQDVAGAIESFRKENDKILEHIPSFQASFEKVLPNTIPKDLSTNRFAQSLIQEKIKALLSPDEGADEATRLEKVQTKTENRAVNTIQDALKLGAAIKPGAAINKEEIADAISFLQNHSKKPLAEMEGKDKLDALTAQLFPPPPKIQPPPLLRQERARSLDIGAKAKQAAPAQEQDVTATLSSISRKLKEPSTASKEAQDAFLQVAPDLFMQLESKLLSLTKNKDLSNADKKNLKTANDIIDNLGKKGVKLPPEVQELQSAIRLQMYPDAQKPATVIKGEPKLVTEQMVKAKLGELTQASAQLSAKIDELKNPKKEALQSALELGVELAWKKVDNTVKELNKYPLLQNFRATYTDLKNALEQQFKTIDEINVNYVEDKPLRPALGLEAALAFYDVGLDIDKTNYQQFAANVESMPKPQVPAESQPQQFQKTTEAPPPPVATPQQPSAPTPPVQPSPVMQQQPPPPPVEEALKPQAPPSPQRKEQISTGKKPEQPTERVQQDNKNVTEASQEPPEKPSAFSASIQAQSEKIKMSRKKFEEVEQAQKKAKTPTGFLPEQLAGKFKESQKLAEEEAPSDEEELYEDEKPVEVPSKGSPRVLSGVMQNIKPPENFQVIQAEDNEVWDENIESQVNAPPSKPTATKPQPAPKGTETKSTISKETQAAKPQLKRQKSQKNQENVSRNTQNQKTVNSQNKKPRGAAPPPPSATAQPA